MRKIKWFGDTGASWHMIGRKYLSKAQIKNAIATNRMVKLATANGTISTNLRVPLKTDVISDQVNPLLIDECPPILSIGQLCMETGYSFYWPAGKKPFLVNRKGKRIEFKIEDNCPYLADNGEIAYPSTVSKGQPSCLTVKVGEVELNNTWKRIDRDEYICYWRLMKKQSNHHYPFPTSKDKADVAWLRTENIGTRTGTTFSSKTLQAPRPPFRQVNVL